MSNKKPLIVDLDGTVILSDILHESVLNVAKKSLKNFLKIPFYLFKGKAVLKKFLANNTDIDISLLPYNIEFLKWLKIQKNDGRKIVLCTGTDSHYANKIASHLKLFDDVMASDGVTNLTGKNKANALIKIYGEMGFDYAGNSFADIEIWKASYSSILVNCSRGLKKKVIKISNVVEYFPKSKIGLKLFVKALRVHQWLKNILLFAPMIAAHMIGDLSAWKEVFIGFIAFSGCASSIYIINDLLDLENDRSHPRKKHRPFASGEMPYLFGIMLAPFLLTLSFIISSFLSMSFIVYLFIYLVITTLYSFILKSLIIIDVITLGMLYTLRIIAGGAILSLPMSPWLLAFSIFLFISLAFIKRYAELEILDSNGSIEIKGRGYLVTDAPLIQTMGIASAFSAVMIFVLYLNSPEIIELYSSPEVIWLCIPILVFWQSWMWLCAHRGHMHDDPIVFAIKDRSSLIAGLLFIGVLFLGSLSF